MKAAFGAGGEIATIDLLGAFCAVGREGTTGKAVFLRGTERVTFVFDRGVLVDVEAPGESSVPEVLIRSGKLQRVTYEALVVPPGEDRFEVATSSGVVSRRESAWGRKLSAIESLASLLAWPEGSYVFEPLVADPSDGFRLPIDKWILELFLRSNDRALVMSRLGPTDLPLVKADVFAKAFAALGLTADADSVASLVDGKRSVEQIVRKAHAEEFAVLKLLAALITLGLIRPSYEAPFAESAPGPGDALPEIPAQPPGEADSLESLSEDGPFETPEVRSGPEEAAIDSLPASPPEPAPSIPEPIALPLFALTAPERIVPERTEQAPDPGSESTSEAEGPVRRRGGIGAAVLFALVAIALWWWTTGRERRPGVSATIAARRASTATSPAVPERRNEIVVVPARPEKAGPPAARAPTTKAPRAEKIASAEKPAGIGAAKESSAWKAAAERGRRVFEHPGENAYTIQLELACEESTVMKALRADPSGRRIWIAPDDYRGRRCYRILFGKFRTLPAAKQAKGLIPPIFLQDGNHPAVIALSGKKAAKAR